jgi:hypothetical protein
VGEVSNFILGRGPEVVSPNQRWVMRNILAWKMVSRCTLAQRFTQSSIYPKVSDRRQPWMHNR